eukprot:PhF_6_TR44217/c0_g1_i3/m.67919
MFFATFRLRCLLTKNDVVGMIAPRTAESTLKSCLPQLVSLTSEITALSASSKRASSTTTSRPLINKCHQLLSTASVPFSMDLNDTELKDAIRCLHSCNALNAGEFSILFTDWLSGKVTDMINNNENSTAQAVHVIEMLMQYGVTRSSEEGINTYMFRALAKVYLIKLIHQTHISSDMLVLTRFVAKSFRVPDDEAPLEVQQDIFAALVRQINKVFRVSLEMRGADEFTRLVKVFIEMSETVKEHVPAIEDIVFHYISHANVNHAPTQCITLLQESASISPPARAKFMEPSLNVARMHASEMTSIEHVLSYLTLLSTLHGQSPPAVENVYQELQAAVVHTLMSNDCFRLPLLKPFDALRILNVVQNDSNKDYILAYLQSVLLPCVAGIQSVDLATPDTHNRISLAASVFPFLVSQSDTSNSNALLTALVSVHKELLPADCANIFKGLSLNHQQHLIKITDLKVVEALFMRGTIAGDLTHADDAVVTLASVLSVYPESLQPLLHSEEFLKKCSSTIASSKHSELKVCTAAEVIAVLKFFVSVQSNILAGAFTTLSNRLVTVSPTLTSTEIIDVVECLRKGELRHDKLMGSLVQRATSQRLGKTPQEGLQLFQAFTGIGLRHVQLAESLIPVIGVEPSLFPALIECLAKVNLTPSIHVTTVLQSHNDKYLLEVTQKTSQFNEWCICLLRLQRYAEGTRSVAALTVGIPFIKRVPLHLLNISAASALLATVVRMLQKDSSTNQQQFFVRVRNNLLKTLLATHQHDPNAYDLEGMLNADVFDVVTYLSEYAIATNSEPCDSVLNIIAPRLASSIHTYTLPNAVGLLHAYAKRNICAPVLVSAVGRTIVRRKTELDVTTGCTALHAMALLKVRDDYVMDTLLSYVGRMEPTMSAANASMLHFAEKTLCVTSRR